MPSSSTSLLFSNADTTSQTEINKRDFRYERRSQIQSFSRRERIKRCGKVAVGQVEIGLTSGIAHFRNLETCGNVWLCSVCSAKVLSARGNEISAAIEKWTEVGKPFVFQTLTMSHTASLSFAEVREAAFTAFAKTNTGRFAQIHKDFGQEGYLKVVEVTVGPNGWHLHFHVLRFINEWLPADKAQDWEDKVFDKWSSSLVSMGLTAPKQKYHDFQQLVVAEDIDGYFTKSYDNPREMASSTLKLSSVGRTTWDLVPEALANPSSVERRLWLEFEAASTGMRQISWARGFRKSLGLGEASTDEELASESSETYEALIHVDNKDAALLGTMGRVTSRMLRLIENRDLLGACSVLAEHGVSFWLTDAGAQLITTTPDPPSGV
jgi:hypothetical protein